MDFVDLFSAYYAQTMEKPRTQNNDIKNNWHFSTITFSMIKYGNGLVMCATSTHTHTNLLDKFEIPFWLKTPNEPLWAQLSL